MPLVHILKFCKVAWEGIDLTVNFLVASLFCIKRWLLFSLTDPVAVLFEKCQRLSITSPWGTQGPHAFFMFVFLFLLHVPWACSGHHTKLCAFLRSCFSASRPLNVTFSLSGVPLPSCHHPSVLGKFIYLFFKTRFCFFCECFLNNPGLLWYLLPHWTRNLPPRVGGFLSEGLVIN